MLYKAGVLFVIINYIFFTEAIPVTNYKDATSSSDSFVFELPKTKDTTNLLSRVSTLSASGRSYGQYPTLNVDQQAGASERVLNPTDKDAIVYPDDLTRDSYGNIVTPYTTPVEHSYTEKPKVNQGIGFMTDVNKDQTHHGLSDNNKKTPIALQFALPSYADGITDIQGAYKPTTGILGIPHQGLLPPLSSGNYNYPSLTSTVHKQPSTNPDNSIKNEILKDTPSSGQTSGSAILTNAPVASYPQQPNLQTLNSNNYGATQPSFAQPNAPIAPPQTPPTNNLNFGSLPQSSYSQQQQPIAPIVPQVPPTNNLNFGSQSQQQQPIAPIVPQTPPTNNLNFGSQPQSSYSQQQQPIAPIVPQTPPTNNLNFGSSQPPQSSYPQQQHPAPIAPQAPTNFGAANDFTSINVAPQKSNTPVSSFPLLSNTGIPQSTPQINQIPVIIKKEPDDGKYTGGFGGAPGILGEQKEPGYLVKPTANAPAPSNSGTYNQQPTISHDHYTSSGTTQQQPQQQIPTNSYNNSPPTHSSGSSYGTAPTHSLSPPASVATHPQILSTSDKYTGGFGGPPGILTPYDNVAKDHSANSSPYVGPKRKY